MKNLKLLSYLFVAVLCLGFVSCSDDDDDPTFEDSQVVGAWTATKMTGYYHDEEGDKIPVSVNFETGDLYYVFDEDGTGYDNNNDYGDDDEFEWTLKNGNQLTLDYVEYDPVTYKIVQLNSSTCVIQYKGKDEDGTYDMKITLKKYNP